MVQNNIYEEKSYQEVRLLCICIEKQEVDKNVKHNTKRRF